MININSFSDCAKVSHKGGLVKKFPTSVPGLKNCYKPLLLNKKVDSGAYKAARFNRDESNRRLDSKYFIQMHFQKILLRI